MQRAAIVRAARAQKQRIDVWYSEKVSSASRSKPERERLLEDVRGGRVTGLWVYRLDRLSRGGICETLNIVQTFEQYGCRPRSVADGFSLGGPGDEIILAVLAWAAAKEREAILERIASARIRIEAAGGTWGRPRRIAPEDAVAKKIHRLKRQKKTIRAIAMAVHVPKSTVARILSQKEAPETGRSTATKSGVKRLAPPRSH